MNSTYRHPISSSRNRLAWYVAVFAVLAAAIFARTSMLTAPFVSDDYVLLAALENRSPAGNTTLALWAFYDGDPKSMQQSMERGGIPWWTVPGAKHAFLRPLSSAVMVGLHGVFGSMPLGYYLVHFFLYAAMFWVAALLFRRWLSAPASLVALLVLAFQTIHVQPSLWISAIHIPISTSLGLAAVLFHQRWREDQYRPGGMLSLALAAAGLAAGEGGLPPLAYIVAYELFGRRDSFASRLRALLPTMVLIFGYVISYELLGFGAAKINGYLSPFTDFSGFLPEAWTRFWARIQLLVPPPFQLSWGRAGSVAFLVVAAPALVAVIQRSEHIDFRRLWYVFGAVFAIVPGLPGAADRSAVAATIGSSAFLAVVFEFAWIGTRTAIPGRVLRVLMGGAVACVLVGTVGLGISATASSAADGRTYADWVAKTFGSASVADLADRHVVALGSPYEDLGQWGGAIYATYHERAARSWHTLTTTRQHLLLIRRSSSEIELACVNSMPFDMGLYRDSATYPMEVGDRVELPIMTVTVLEVRNGAPSRVSVRFDRNLDDPSLRFVRFSQEGIETVRMPGKGETLRIPPLSLANL
jgi:hypothetical protein